MWSTVGRVWFNQGRLVKFVLMCLEQIPFYFKKLIFWVEMRGNSLWVYLFWGEGEIVLALKFARLLAKLLLGNFSLCDLITLDSFDLVLQTSFLSWMLQHTGCVVIRSCFDQWTRPDHWILPCWSAFPVAYRLLISTSVEFKWQLGDQTF